jgi:hypothetical protein
MKQMTRTSKVALWSIQGLLAALFLFAGGMKLVMPIEMMKGPVLLPLLSGRPALVAQPFRPDCADSFFQPLVVGRRKWNFRL